MKRVPTPTSTPMPLCPGTVVVHRDEAMTCTSLTCPRHLSQAQWSGIHSTFVPCSAAAGPEGCPDCRFDSATVIDLARWRRARYSHHPSVQPADDSALRDYSS